MYTYRMHTEVLYANMIKYVYIVCLRYHERTVSPDKLLHPSHFHPIQPSDKGLYFPQVTSWRTCRLGFWIGVSTYNVHSNLDSQNQCFGVELALWEFLQVLVLISVNQCYDENNLPRH